MEIMLFETRIKYDVWFKILLLLSVIIVVVTGIIFYLDAHVRDVIPGQPAEESAKGWVVLLAAAIFMLVIFRLILPQSIAVTRQGIVLKFRTINWKIPFETIRSIEPVSGLFVFWAHSWITSYGSQIEIYRKNRLKIRVCPGNRDQFIEYADKALSDWKKTRPA